MRFVGRNLFGGVLALSGLVMLGAWAPQALATDNVKFGYVQSWPSSSVTTHLAARIIEDKLGTPVDLKAVTAGPMYQGVESGDLDATLTAWLPVTHESYYSKGWSKVLNLGPNLRGTQLGLVVPSYVDDINSIEDLKDHADEFDGKIVGVGAGAGVNKGALKAIDQYGLDMELQKSSTASMAASLKRAVDRNEPIVITGWSPLWIWGKFDLKYLKDPKQIFGQSGYIATLTSTELPDTHPGVYQFLQTFELKLSQLNAIEALSKKDGMDEADAIDQWISHHPGPVNHWLASVTDTNMK